MNIKLYHEIIKPLRECLNLVFPPVMPLLIREAAKQKPDFEELTRLISIDPGLTVTVLSLANSSYYSLNQKVTDIKRAIVVLGSTEILKLAISVTFKKSISQKMSKCRHVEFKNWSVMLWSALASEKIAQQVCPKRADSLYLCALVKDLSLFLLCCSDDPRLKQYEWLCGKDNQPMLCLKPDQLRQEKDNWGVDHSFLTTELLTYWGFPENDCAMVVDHHDLENIDVYDPAKQVLIFATYWSEVEMSEQGISQLFQVRTMAKTVFGLEHQLFEQIRTEVSERFSTMCLKLGISPRQDDVAYHEFRVSKIQDLYFAAQELQDVQGDLTQVAKTIAKHLHWLWALDNFEVSLLSPLTQEYNLFTKTPDTRMSMQSSTEQRAGRESGPGIVFYLGESGYIRVNQRVNEDTLAEIDLYTNFLTKNFDGYYCRTLNTTSKARIMDFIPQAVARISQDGKIIQVNKRFSDIFHLRPDSRGKHYWSLVKNLVRIERDNAWDHFLNSGSRKFSKLYCPLEPLMETSDAHCWHMTAHRVVMDGATQILVMLEDVTEISTLERDIIRQGDYLRGIISSMQDIVFTVDKTGTILFVSPAYKHSLLGKNFFQVATPSSVLTTSWGPETLAKEGMPVEVNLNIGNSSKAMELVFNRLSDTPSPEYLIVGRDLTTIRRMEEKIKKQATFDHLTRVFNRYQFALFLERETQRSLRSGSGLGLIFFDLDRFKEFNDRFGHQKGDEALKTFGRLLISNSRKGMDYPCRYGGDEFVLLVTATDKQKMESLVKRLLESFQKEFDSRLNLSIGMALMLAGEDKDSFLSRADKAVFEAKNIPGNIYVWAKNN
ncbi:MAG: diguanylate cyclase domain-containing protein [Desulfonatronovibrio sp.]